MMKRIQIIITRCTGTQYEYTRQSEVLDTITTVGTRIPPKAWAAFRDAQCTALNVTEPGVRVNAQMRIS